MIWRCVSPKEVLKRIIEQSGSCDDLHPSDCRTCPFSKLKFKEDGNALSCSEALGIDDSAIDSDGFINADSVYLEAAKRELINLEMDDILKEDDAEQ